MLLNKSIIPLKIRTSAIKNYLQLPRKRVEYPVQYTLSNHLMRMIWLFWLQYTSWWHNLVGLLPCFNNLNRLQDSTMVNDREEVDAVGKMIHVYILLETFVAITHVDPYQDPAVHVMKDKSRW